MLGEIKRIEKHIKIKRIFLDGGDEYEKASEYISRNIKRINQSLNIFNIDKYEPFKSCKDITISPWVRCSITKILCLYFGAEMFELGGLDTDK